MRDPVLTDPDAFRCGMSMEKTRLLTIESQLAQLLRYLLTACEKPSAVRRDLLSLAGQVQEIQRRALAEARRR